jgi:hypothetical protein
VINGVVNTDNSVTCNTGYSGILCEEKDCE